MTAHALRVISGSAVLARSYGRWLWTGELRAVTGRLVGNGLAGAYLGSIAYHHELIAAAAGCAWCFAAYRSAPRTAADRARADKAFIKLLRDAIGDANGVLLADVLATIHAAGHLPEWTVSDVRALCERLGIPVKDKIKVSGRVSVGVHRDDLDAAHPRPTPPPLATPSPRGSSAGHRSTTPLTTYAPEGVTCTPHVPVGVPATDVEDAFADALALFHDAPPALREGHRS